MKERVSRSTAPQKVPRTASFSTRDPEARGWKRSWGRSWGAGRTGRKPAPSALGAPGSLHSALSALSWPLPTAGVHVLCLPPVFAPRRPQGRRKQALSARDVTSERPLVTLFIPSSLARDLGLSKHQSERPSCSAPLPKPAALWKRAGSQRDGKQPEKG